MLLYLKRFQVIFILKNEQERAQAGTGLHCEATSWGWDAVCEKQTLCGQPPSPLQTFDTIVPEASRGQICNCPKERSKNNPKRPTVSVQMGCACPAKGSMYIKRYRF